MENQHTDSWKIVKEVIYDNAYKTKKHFDSAMMNKVNDRISDRKQEILDNTNNISNED
jgi:hypothetical protein